MGGFSLSERSMVAEETSGCATSTLNMLPHMVVDMSNLCFGRFAAEALCQRLPSSKTILQLFDVLLQSRCPVIPALQHQLLQSCRSCVNRDGSCMRRKRAGLRHGILRLEIENLRLVSRTVGMRLLERDCCQHLGLVRIEYRFLRTRDRCPPSRLAPTCSVERLGASSR